MADRRHEPTGETTLPPPVPAPPSEAAAEPVAVAVAPGREPTDPVFLRPPAPGPNRRRRGPRRTWRWWVGRSVPLAGLGLMLGCLYGLLAGFPLANWELGGRSNGSGAGGLRTFGDGAPAVVLDPGHGGVDTGATALGLQEKALNLDVALRVARVLASQGIPVRLTRTTDQAVSLEDRVRIANAAQGAIFVSIHFNDALASDHGASYHASGVETYYSERKEAGATGDWLLTSLFGGGAARRDALAWSVHEGEQLAAAIQGSLVLATSAADRGTKERGLYVTRRVRGPAVLVEGGFISHPGEAKHLGEPAYRQKLADAIAAGIVQYLQTASRPPVPGGSTRLPAGA